MRKSSRIIEFLNGDVKYEREKIKRNGGSTQKVQCLTNQGSRGLNTEWKREDNGGIKRRKLPGSEERTESSDQKS